MTLPEAVHALYLEEGADGGRVARLGDLPSSVLPEGDVLVRVAYSSLNYKDAMIVKGRGYRIEAFPFVPGIDLAGTVAESDSPDFAPGDRVVLTGFGAGETFAGGYASHARVRAEWLLRLPDELTERDAMAVGTAGITAAIAAAALERDGVAPESGPVLVTGAAGGVGSVAVALLAALGYRVSASTGRPQEAPYLEALGAAEVIPRAELSAGPDRPLMARRWAGCVDSVGGATLATVLASLEERGVAAACGLAGGNEVTASLLPFLLRGVRLVGVNAARGPVATLRAAWARIAGALPRERLARIATVALLAEVPRLAEEILAGRVRGRTVIDVAGEARAIA